MKIIEKLDSSFSKEIGETCVCIGMFDGVHKGHQLLILKTVHSARENKQSSVLLTFQNNPKLFKKESTALTSNKEKNEIIKSLGIDYIVQLPFPGNIAEMSPLDFIESILQTGLHSSNVFVGKNFRFGFNRSGNSDDLKYMGSERNMHVMVEHMVNWEGKEISSTYCRYLVHTRQFEKVCAMLGYPYFISGTVIHGQGRGGKIGVPTLNLCQNYPEKIKPQDGVYITKTLMNGKLYTSLTLYGPVPSFDQHEKSIETLVLDFEGDAYGENVTIFFHSFLREITKFESASGLVEQIELDKARAREFGKTPTKLSPLLMFLQ